MTPLSEFDWCDRPEGLSGDFRQSVAPTPLPDPRLVAWNPGAANRLGLGPASEGLIELLAGNRIPDGLQPGASGYAGHQFGVWVPQLGDGRAITIGSAATIDGGCLEVQLKGSGPTRWSRMGDGRAVLRSTVREYLGSAAMAGLGIPTTTALAIVGSDLPVYRERTETAAVLTRLTPSHLRFGSIQWLASLGEVDALRSVIDLVIARHYTELEELPIEGRYPALLSEIVERTARLMANWIAVGFSHGVMNTDNFSILGETIDYGPFGWLDRYDPEHVCNHSDWEGRYAFGRQPEVGLWNCARLGEALIPLIGKDFAVDSLNRYHTAYQEEAIGLMRAKLGLVAKEGDDVELASDLLQLMYDSQADFTRSFRALSYLDSEQTETTPTVASEFGAAEATEDWLRRYRSRVDREPRSGGERRAAMLATNPKFVLRNWVAEEVIGRAESGDLSAVDEVRAILDRPHDEHPKFDRMANRPPPGSAEIVVSCSS